MSIFSSKKKTYVDTAVMRVVEDEMIPNSLLNGMMEAVIRNRDIPETARAAVLNGSFRNFERMYRYAERGDYFYGLPNARVLTDTDGAELVKAAIEIELGLPVTVDYSYFRPINNQHVGWKHLFEVLAYAEETNEITGLSTVKGYPVFLEKLVSIHQVDPESPPEYTSLEGWGSRASSSGVTPVNPVAGLSDLVVGEQSRFGADEEESVEIHYLWEVPAVTNVTTGEITTPAVIHREVIVLSLASYDMDLEYFQARYRYTQDATEHTRLWIYNPETGVHPDLDELFALNYTNPGTYFPFAIFRREKQNRATEALQDTEEYQTTEKLLKYIGIDFQTFSDSVHENPDIEDIEQAVLMMAVPITTEDPVEMDYLYRFFSRLHTTIGVQAPLPGSAQEAQMLAQKHKYRSYAVEIADADFRIVLSLDGINKRYVPLVIGPIGTHTNEISLVEDGAALPFGFEIPGITTRATRRLRKQVTSTVCEEIYIINLTLRYDIYKDKSVIGAEEDERTLIPLDYELVREMQLMDREYLYYRSAHFVANSRVTIKVKWYESSWFRAVLMIAAVVLTIMSMGSDGGFFIQAAAAIAAGLTATVVFLLKIVLTHIITTLVFNELAKLLGPEWAAIMAIAMIAFGVYKGMSTGFGQGTWANNLVTVGNGLLSGAQNAMQRRLQGLQADQAEFLEETETKWEELEEVSKLLDSKSLLDPFAFIGLQPLTVFGEHPQDLYARTVHSGNIGVVSFEIVENFVDISLRLPSIHDTAGDTFYV